jgi:uncharacterized Zn finger protein (UPF0148 family)
LNLRESQVPDFPQANQDPGVDKFLAQYGLRYEEFPITPNNAPVGYHFILGISPRGGEHAIVGKDGHPAWDPHPSNKHDGQGLVKPERYGILVNEFEKAKDALLSGKQLHNAAEELRSKHDEVKQSPLRTGNPATAYNALRQPTAALVVEAEKLLVNAKLDDDPSYWRNKMAAARKALETSTKAAQSRDYGKAAAYLDAALSLAHMVIDKMRNSGRARDMDPRAGVTKCQQCGAPLNGDDVAEVNGKVVCPDCADRRIRLHRALDCVMDRARASDVSEQSLQVALTRAEKHVEAARSSVSLAVEARRNKGERLQSTREIKARSKLREAHMEVYKAESALKDYRERN